MARRGGCGRLAEEHERVRSYERTVSLVALELGPTQVPLAELVRAASAPLRLMDVVGQAGTSVVVLLPELEEEAAEDVAQQLLEALSPWAPGPRGLGHGAPGRAEWRGAHRRRPGRGPGYRPGALHGPEPRLPCAAPPRARPSLSGRAGILPNGSDLSLPPRLMKGRDDALAHLERAPVAAHRLR
jgi:hypothetical protein